MRKVVERSGKHGVEDAMKILLQNRDPDDDRLRALNT